VPEGTIQYRNSEGRDQSRPVPNINAVINHPESFPEAYQMGSRVLEGNVEHRRDAYGAWHTTNVSPHY